MSQSSRRARQPRPPVRAAPLRLLAAFLVGATACSSAHRELPTTDRAAEAGDRIFELRTYTTHPGRLPALNARFREHTTRLFAKHGMTNIGYWVPTDTPRVHNTLIYVLAHRSRDAARQSWAAFRADSEWVRARTASEASGPIVLRVESVFMSPTDYSRMK